MNKYLRMNSAGTLPYVSLNSDNSLTYDYPILSDTLNPAVWAVVKLQGWNSNPDYLTKLEAAAVTSFPDNMFDGNTDITSFNELVYFTSLTALPQYCFTDCPNLIEITLSPSIKSIGRMCFGIRGSNWNYETFYSHLEHIYNFEQLEYFGLNSLLFTFNLSLNPYSFSGFKSGIVPEDTGGAVPLSGYRTVNGVYYDLYKLKQIYFPNAVHFHILVFFRAICFEEIYIGNNCTDIESYCFGQQASVYNSGYHPNLRKVDIGTGIQNIAAKPFNLTPNLEYIIIRATSVPTITPIDNTYELSVGNPNYKIYVPDASVNAYKAAEGWSTLADRIFPLSQIEN